MLRKPEGGPSGAEPVQAVADSAQEAVVAMRDAVEKIAMMVPEKAEALAKVAAAAEYPRANVVKFFAEEGERAPNIRDTIDGFFRRMNFSVIDFNAVKWIEALKAGLEGNTVFNRGFQPIIIKIKDLLMARNALDDDGVSRRVIGVSVDGTNSKGGLATVLNGEVGLEEFDTKKLKTKEGGVPEFEDDVAFWGAILPEAFLDWVRETMEGGSTANIALTLGYPIEEGKIKHLSGEVRCPSLAPFDAVEAAGAGTSWPTVAESLQRYLESEGLRVPAENIQISANDTVSSALAIGPTFINGSSTNACVIDEETGEVINLELGHFSGMSASALDRAVSPPVDFEKIVSGNVLGEVFKLAAISLLTEGHPLMAKIGKLSNEEAGPLLFKLAGGAKVEGLEPREERFLAEIAGRLRDRVVNYIVGMALTVEAATGKPISFGVEGSVFTGNPDLMRRLEVAYNRHKAVLLGLWADSGLVSTEVLDRLKSDNVAFELRRPPCNLSTDLTSHADAIDSSFVGTFLYGAAAEKLREAQ